ncbi:hypothetical protein IAT38_005065 [Cryptococcus sp. DSM 104549]
MLLANYASDSDSDTEAPPPAPKVAPPPPTRPPVLAASTASQPKKKPKKITLGLPGVGTQAGSDAGSGSEREDGDGAGSGEEGREVKRAKGPKGGKGSSSLLGMLPPPKRKLPAKASAPSKAASLTVNKSMARTQLPAPPKKAADSDDEDEEDGKVAGGLLPASLARKGAKGKAAEPELDLFGLAAAPAPAPSLPTTTSLKPPTISSAPLAPSYVPPEPTATDPYPGYYQLPSGEWRAHDPAYYASLFPSGPSASGSASGSSKKPAVEDDGRLGKHWDSFETGQFAGKVLDIDANQGLAEGRAEQERRERSKKPKLPGDEFEYKPQGQIKGLASQRHQLTSLLNTAYTQREELEERIAHNKKNMRMAGTKYGF